MHRAQRGTSERRSLGNKRPDRRQWQPEAFACSSRCGARCLTESAALLVDGVFAEQGARRDTCHCHRPRFDPDTRLLWLTGTQFDLSGLVSGANGLALAPSFMNFDIWVMLAVALACLPVFLTGREIARWEGAVFLAYYFAYVAYLVLAAQSHAALRPFSASMLGFVLPITVVTFVVVWLGQQRPVDQ